jgi:hypothetical protein
MRLKASINSDQITDPQAKVIVEGMKEYGLIFLDGGYTVDFWAATSDFWNFWTFYQISGHDGIKGLTVDDFEFVQGGEIYCDTLYNCSKQPSSGPPPGIRSFKADKTTILPGAPVKLSWKVSNVPTRIRFITPDVGPVVQDHVIVRPQKTTTYKLMVQNGNVDLPRGNGRTEATVTVTVSLQ